MKHRQEEYWKPRFHAPPLQSHPDPPPVIQCSWYPHEGQCPYLKMALICWRGNGECTFTDILASDTDIDAQTYQQMRGKSYQEVLRTNGQISFPEVLRQQSRL